jgi:hypothetical protein
MRRTYYLLVLAVLTSIVGSSAVSPQGQYPIADKVAAKVIEKYQTSSCQQLAAMKKEPPSGPEAEMKQRAIAALKQDPQMRQYFLDKVAGPIANKLFECGMIP